MIIASKHFPRIITGAVLVSVLGTALYLSGPYLFGLLLLFTLVGLWEFYAMFWPLKANIGGLALGGLLITAAWMRPEMVVMTLALSTLILACMFLFCWSHDDKYRFTRVAVLAGGLLYVPMLIMPALNFSIHEQLLLICTAAGSSGEATAGTAAGSDTVAYFFGMRFGKHKIWPKVSPKKSVEGSAAGLAASVVVAVCFGLAFGVPATGISDYALLGLVLGVMAQLGDFFESALKRSRSVKDSGNVLPGHGGVLDRVDSLLFDPDLRVCQGPHDILLKRIALQERLRKEGKALSMNVFPPFLKPAGTEPNLSLQKAFALIASLSAGAGKH